MSVRTCSFNYYTAIRTAAALLLLGVALVWLTYQLWRLLWQPPPLGAIDLRTLHGLVHGWFSGEPIYSVNPDAIHPPATYAILWPLLGWLTFKPARWLWAVTTVAALGWLAHLVIRESHADTLWERIMAALLPFSMYATGAAIGNGQIIIHLLPMLIFGLVLLNRQHRGWGIDMLAGALILINLVKPSISAPFFWIVVFTARSLRPALLVGLGYSALTVFAISYQQHDPTILVREWLARSSTIAVTPGQGNVANLHVWFGSVGLQDWILPTSLVMLAALGYWIYCHRYVDLWLLLGVTAYFSRFWTYHRWYDDLLILLPLVALFRLAKQPCATPGVNIAASALLVVTTLAMLAPGGLFLFPPPWNMHYVAGQVILWILGLMLLLGLAWQERCQLNSYRQSRVHEIARLI